jgi:hypothetical protein
MFFRVKDFPAIGQMHSLLLSFENYYQIIIDKILTALRPRGEGPRHTTPDGDKLISNFNGQIIS